MRSSSRRGTGTMRRVVAGHLAAIAGLALALTAVLLPGTQARAEAERIRLVVGFAQSLDRFHSPEADTTGLSFGRAYCGEIGVDFRVLDLPMPKAPRPALHVTAGALTDERTLGPVPPGTSTDEGTLEPVPPGQPLTRQAVLVLRSGVHLLIPLELLRPNSGVAFRIGWSGAYVLERTGGAEFLTITKARFGFERTAGWFEGSCVDVGMGRDETYGREFAAKRWDVRVALQGRLLPQPSTARP
jgi:hypothetical protein